MSNNFFFGLSAPNDCGAAENMAFSCFAQAQEGDFTVGQTKLRQAAKELADRWKYRGVYPSGVAIDSVCLDFGFNFDNLLAQEQDYFLNRLREELAYHGFY